MRLQGDELKCLQGSVRASTSSITSKPEKESPLLQDKAANLPLESSEDFSEARIEELLRSGDVSEQAGRLVHNSTPLFIQFPGSVHSSSNTMSNSEFDKPNLRPESKQRFDQSECQRQTQSPSEAEVLLELFNLLEQYAPMWYAEEHHNRAVTALRSSPKSIKPDKPR